MNFNFDAWREGYDGMTWPDHVETYSKLHALYPVQQHFDSRACGQFLDIMRPHSVWEIGGWDGELASIVLGTRPWIDRWENVDVCREVVATPICRDPRYSARLGPQLLTGDVLVMSHVAEHMRWDELRFLFGRIPAVKAVYLASPLPLDGSNPDWRGYPGPHILEAGWDEIDRDLITRGFHLMQMPQTHEVRCWAR